jgi:AcrR family transcriptional regulator
MRSADRRRQLLEVATKIASDGGMEALQIETLANAAGVSRPIVYEQFGDREGLLIALIEDYTEFLDERMAAALEGESQDAAALLRATVHAYFGCVKERGGSRTLLASSGSSPAIDEARSRTRRRAIGRGARQIAERTGASLRDAEVVAEMAVAAAWSLAGSWLDGRISRKRAETLYVRMMLAWLTALRHPAD